MQCTHTVMQFRFQLIRLISVLKSLNNVIILYEKHIFSEHCSVYTVQCSLRWKKSCKLLQENRMLKYYRFIRLALHNVKSRLCHKGWNEILLRSKRDKARSRGWLSFPKTTTDTGIQFSAKFWSFVNSEYKALPSFYEIMKLAILFSKRKFPILMSQLILLCDQFNQWISAR